MGNELITENEADSLPSGTRISPEILVPRLGDYLLEVGVLLPEDLQHALDYQKKRELEGNPCLLGQALRELGLIDRDTLDQVITRQLVSLQSTLRDTNRQLELRVRQRTQDLERRLVQIRTTAEITQLAISAPDLNDLLYRTVHLIAERFGYHRVSVFLIDQTGQFAVLREANGIVGKSLKEKDFRLEVGSESMVGWVAAHNQARVADDVSQDPFYLMNELLSEIKSETTIPIAIGNPEGQSKVLGVLDVQHTELGSFDPDVVAMLQTLANHIAVTIQNIRLLEVTQHNLQEISSLYKTSHQITQANTTEDIFHIAADFLKQAPYLSAILLAEHKQFRVYMTHTPDEDNSPDNSSLGKTLSRFPETLTLSPAEIDHLFTSNSPWIIDLDQTTDLPEALVAVPRQMGCKLVTFIPLHVNTNLEALFVLGVSHKEILTPKIVEPYASLAEIITTALEKIYALQKVEKRLATLQSLNAISKAVSVETDITALYRAIHSEITQLMGDVGFLIAIYNPTTDLISIPYMWESHDQGMQDNIPPFPLGEGLTSLLIHTRQPLMIVEDTLNRAKALGAKIVGAPARSWLGVPLLIGGEAIGAIIVQDIENEFRFDEDDQRLLSTLASQVAAVIRNARMLDSTYRQAERERLLHEVASRIRSSTDIRTILEITAQELGKALRVKRAHIEVGVNDDIRNNNNISENPSPPPEPNGSTHVETLP